MRPPARSMFAEVERFQKITSFQSRIGSPLGLRISAFTFCAFEVENSPDLYAERPSTPRNEMVFCVSQDIDPKTVASRQGRPNRNTRGRESTAGSQEQYGKAIGGQPTRLSGFPERLIPPAVATMAISETPVCSPAACASVSFGLISPQTANEDHRCQKPGREGFSSTRVRNKQGPYRY